MATMTTELFDQLNPLLPDLRLPYCPHTPTPKQEFFLLRDELEVFFGGAAGGAKSWALLMAALQYVDVPGYAALLLRPALTEFEQQGGLIEHCHTWLGPQTTLADGPWWNGTRREWKFKSGATLRFSYLANQADLSHYKGGAVSFLGFDELTSWPTELLYQSMFRVVRQARDAIVDPNTGRQVPGRIRSASNPGGPGHGWVKSRFVQDASRVDGAVYIPSYIVDNPHLNFDDYLRTLSHLSPIDRERLIRGDWDVSEEGGKFRRDKFKVIDAAEMLPTVKAVRYWDLAASEPSPANPDPDQTVGLRMDVDRSGTFTVRHIAAGFLSDEKVEALVRSTAEEDGRGVPVFIEQDPGQAGKAQVNHYKRHVLQGYPCYAGSTRIRGVNASKEVRARAVAAAVGNDLVQIVRGTNLHAFLDQVVLFPLAGVHDDFVDALSGAHTALTSKGGMGQPTISDPTRARIGTIGRTSGR